MFRSEMWDADAFGGNGTEPDGCVTDGAFAYYTEHIGPQNQNTVFCMNRSWGNFEAIMNTTGAAVAHCNTFDSYDEYFACIAATPHRGGHWAVGGVVSACCSRREEHGFDELTHRKLDGRCEDLPR